VYLTYKEDKNYFYYQECFLVRTDVFKNGKKEFIIIFTFKNFITFSMEGSVVINSDSLQLKSHKYKQLYFTFWLLLSPYISAKFYVKQNNSCKISVKHLGNICA
jgi:hypothetical protein